MTFKLPVLAVVLLLAALAGGGITYFVVSNQRASANAEVEKRAQDFFAPKDPLPTEGGQKMQPRF
ncbi:DUF2749 domain-containing protein [Rhizobium sp. 1399]|uniref:DUF2749 domain-containing protein n=1 Tax=Rhizobium sp. 1399 TaxID=2817758 RepID=UPI00285D3182|nr:Ti type entry exclusion protein TrbK [Rhizobium sp. 1399]